VRHIFLLLHKRFSLRARRLGREVLRILRIEDHEVRAFDLPDVSWEIVKDIEGVEVFLGGVAGRIRGFRRGGRAVEEFLGLGYEAWAEKKGYGRRWAVETSFSVFKRLFVEHSLARSMDCIGKELVAKVSLYNMLVNI
jgi:hypothetical protein